MAATEWTPPNWPRITRAVQRWYQHRVTQWVDGRAAQKEAGDIADACTAKYAERTTDFLRWSPVEYYHGARFAQGYWSLDLAAAEAAWPQIVQEVRAEQRARAASGYTSLEGWLAAEIAGQIPAGAFPEPHAGRYVVARDRYYRTRNRLEKSWPRLCVKCSQEFRGDRRNAVRCPACRPAKRSPRSAGGGE